MNEMIYTGRLKKVTENMKKAGLDRLLVCAHMSVYYLTGRMIHPGERLVALIVDGDGSLRLIANRLFAQKPLETGSLIEYDDTDDKTEVLSSCVKSGVLGVDKEFKCGFALPFMDARRDVKLVPGSVCVDSARMIKSEAELEAMRESSRLNDRVLSETLASVKPGARETDVAAAYTQNALAAGAEGNSFEPLICFGACCAEPHHDTDATPLKGGDSVILDVGLKKNGFCSDMTRTVFFGGADDEQLKVYDIVKAANAAGKAAVRPGVPLKEVDRAARRVIEDAGYGRFFTHRTGHGIGLEVHEYPDVSAVSEEICVPGMTFSVEPGIYLPGRFGVRIEDLAAVTKDGCEILNSLGREPVILK